MSRRRFSRVGLWAAEMAVRALTVVTDAVPARYRFGHWNRLMGVLSFGETLPTVGRGSEPPSSAAVSTPPPLPSAGDEPALTCLLVAGDLDTGGVETVIATLATGLPEFGFDVEVVCSSGGAVERRLREAGVRVSQLPVHELGAHVARRTPDVIQLHRLDPAVMTQLEPWRSRTVPVLHAMESYLTAEAWGALAALLHAAPASIAVSGSVREYFHGRTGVWPEVVENGVQTVRVPDVRERTAARHAIAKALGVEFAPDDVIMLGLQRFSDQKNPAGLVDAFLLAAESDPRLRLVLAGAPNSWLEVRRADVIRRRHPRGDRVHFLGDSDAGLLFRGADLFALDSFSEGGPIVAVEAVAHGLPLVITEVGFAAELVELCGGHGVLVPRSNNDVSEAAMARQRRRRHQSNRRAFADGILHLAAGPVDADRRAGVPERFTVAAMVARHAAALRSAAAGVARSGRP